MDAHRYDMHRDPAQSTNSMGAWDRPIQGLEGLLGTWGLAAAHGRTRTLVAEAPGNTDWHGLPQRLLFWHQELTNSLKAPVLGCLGPNIQLGEHSPISSSSGS